MPIRVMLVIEVVRDGRVGYLKGEPNIFSGVIVDNPLEAKDYYLSSGDPFQVVEKDLAAFYIEGDEYLPKSALQVDSARWVEFEINYLLSNKGEPRPPNRVAGPRVKIRKK